MGKIGVYCINTGNGDEYRVMFKGREIALGHLFPVAGVIASKGYILDSTPSWIDSNEPVDYDTLVDIEEEGDFLDEAILLYRENHFNKKRTK